MKPSTETLLRTLSLPGESMAQDAAERNAHTVILAIAVLAHAHRDLLLAELDDVYRTAPVEYVATLQKLLEPVLLGGEDTEEGD